MSGSRRLAVALAALALLILMAAPLGSADAGSDSEYILRGALRRVELMDRAPIILEEEVYEGLGGAYRLTITGMGSPLYGKGLLLLPNETGVVDLRLEVLRAPSGYKVAVRRIWMNPRWCSVHFELSAEGLGQPVREEALEFMVGSYATQDAPLSLRLMIKPYAFKEKLPYGGIEGCFIDMRIYGNVSFGANVKKESWYTGFSVYVLNPEDGLYVEVRSPALALKVEREKSFLGTFDRVRSIGLNAELDIRNSLAGDVVLENIEILLSFNPKFSGTTKFSYEVELNNILKPGQAESIKLEREWEEYFTIRPEEGRGNGTMMITLNYLSERGRGVKRFLYAFDLVSGGEPSPRAAATTATVSRAATQATRSAPTTLTTTTTLTTETKPSMGLAALIGSLSRTLINPITILLVLGLVLFSTLLIARRGGRAGARGEAAPPHAPPAPSRLGPAAPAPRPVGEIPIWVYGDCLRVLEGKYREFQSLYDSGRLRYALYALHDGLEAALRLLARWSGALGPQPDTQPALRDIVALLRERNIISDMELELIRRVAATRNKYKHRELTAEPTRNEVDQAKMAYQIVMREFKRRYEDRQPLYTTMG